MLLYQPRSQGPLEDGTIVNGHDWTGVYFQVPFSLPSPLSFLKLPILKTGQFELWRVVGEKPPLVLFLFRVFNPACTCTVRQSGHKC